MRLVGVALLIVGSLSILRVSRGDGPYRTGPWPGLTPAGAGVLLGCALLLAGGQLVLGDPRAPLPDLPLLAILAMGPMALATRLVGAPGAASAVCGAYLLPRTVLSLVDPSIEPPPLLLVPALAFDVSAWLRASDLANLRYLWPGNQSAWRRQRRGSRSLRPTQADVTGGVTPRFYAGGWRRGLVGPRRCGRGRLAVASAIFGGMLALIEPPFAVLLGADPAVWSGSETSLWLAGGLAVLGCAIAGLAASGRGTEA
jgi:hypothetical protein